MNFPQDLKSRQEYIEEQVFFGNFDAKWVEITSNVEGVEVRLLVMDDALKVDGVRINVSATGEQRLADIFGASLPTPKVVDMMYASATRRISPSPQQISSTVEAMIKHSQKIDTMLVNGTGLAATVGKHWVLDAKLTVESSRACNYGWHFIGTAFQGIKGYSPVSRAAGPGVSVIQQNGTAHDRLHSDYSQICQLVNQKCFIDGKEYMFSEIVKDPVLSKFVSHQGKLSIDRQPGVEKLSGKFVEFPVVT